MGHRQDAAHFLEIKNMEFDFKNVKKRYNELKAERDKYTSHWQDIATYVGIKVKPDDINQNRDTSDADDLDKYTEDPTAALSVQLAADYEKGLMWGDGVNAISILPSKHILKLAGKEELSDYYDFVTEELLEQMNHSSAGLNAALSAHFYDQNAFGTSGVGAYPNTAYGKKSETNVLLFRPYGVDTLVIDEGKNSLVDVVFNVFNWRVNRLVEEFCLDEEGKIDKESFAKLPKKVQDAYNCNQLNNTYNIVQAIMPRSDYTPGALGQNGCKYAGYWFEEDADEYFHEEQYKDMPVAVARAVKIRGEVYGRASGTMLLSTIKCINSAISEAMESIAKMVRPPIAILNTALFGDDKIDTSENGLTVLNAAQLGGANPILPMQDVGDPSAIIQWLIPYLNEKVATAFKIDILLDFSAKSSMTATESLERFSIRGRSLSGMIMQQKTELFEPLIKRCISICMDKGILGVNANSDEAKKLTQTEKHKIIPDAVAQCIEEGEEWYQIKFNNEVDKLSKTEKVDDLLKLINVITAMMAVNPQISLAINWYALLSDIGDALGLSKNILSETQFKHEIQRNAEQQRALMAAQSSSLEAKANRDNAAAIKDMRNDRQ